MLYPDSRPWAGETDFWSEAKRHSLMHKYFLVQGYLGVGAILRFGGKISLWQAWIKHRLTPPPPNSLAIECVASLLQKLMCREIANVVGWSFCGNFVFHCLLEMSTIVIISFVLLRILLTVHSKESLCWIDWKFIDLLDSGRHGDNLCLYKTRLYLTTVWFLLSRFRQMFSCPHCRHLVTDWVPMNKGVVYLG